MALTAASIKNCLQDFCTRIAELEDLIEAPEFSFDVTAGEENLVVTGPSGVSNGGSLHFWSDGTIGVEVTPGSPAKVELYANNVTEAANTAGAPAAPPADATKPFVHFAQDKVFFWSPTTGVWEGANGIGDDWGAQVAVTDGVTIAGNGLPGNPIRAITASLDRHPLTQTEIFPSLTGIVTIPELDVLENPTGRNTQLNLSPSPRPCNGLFLDPDFNNRYFVEDHGYRAAETWQDIIDILTSGEDVLVCGIITVPAGGFTIESDRTILFVGNGALDFQSMAIAGNQVRMDVRMLNPNNRRVFLNTTINETYPSRWTGLGSILIGTFGGDNVRRASWWGAIANDLAPDANIAEREQNNHAIAAAALSQAPIGSGAFAPVTIELDRGWFSIWRTIRLDGIQAFFKGNGDMQAGTRLVCDSNQGLMFNTDHFINTNKFPGGTTPVIEIGYERQNGVAPVNPDEGFRCGVENITLRLPVVAHPRPISGIMWESGLQERSRIRSFAVANYSGYAVGCPEYQTLSHNVPFDATGTFPQVNSILIEEFNIADPAAIAPDAIGIGIFGLNWTIRNGTISHHNGATGPAAPVRNEPAIYCGTRQTAKIQDVHLEHRPGAASLYSGAALVVHDDVAGNANIGSVSIENIMGFMRHEVGINGRTVWTNANNVSFHMSSIRNSRIPSATDACIEDSNRAVMSTGNVQAGVTSGYVALYARQFNSDEGAYRVVTTDFGLL